MAWRNRQRARRRRSELAEKWGERLRAAWAHISPQERVDFLAQLADDAYNATEHVVPRTRPWEPMADHEPEPEIPEFNAAVQRHGGDPLTRALLSPTQLMDVYRGGE